MQWDREPHHWLFCLDSCSERNFILSPIWGSAHLGLNLCKMCKRRSMCYLLHLQLTDPIIVIIQGDNPNPNPLMNELVCFWVDFRLQTSGVFVKKKEVPTSNKTSKQNNIAIMKTTPSSYNGTDLRGSNCCCFLFVTFGLLRTTN